MNEDVKKQVKQVISEQCKERPRYDVGSKEKIQNDANLVNLVKALNEMEKLEAEKQAKDEEMTFEQTKFAHDKDIDERKLGLEMRKLDEEIGIRRYESDAADKRTLMETKAALEKVESEKKSNIFKTIIYGLGILAGVALHLGDVNAEKELGYDVDDRVSSFDKLKNDLKFFSK